MSVERKSPDKVLVLGATSSIAIAACRTLAERGASLYLVGRNADKLAVIEADFKTRGAAYVGSVVLDLDDTARHPAMLAEAVNSLGGLDLALIAHGVLGDQTAAEEDFAVAGAILHTNFISAVSLCTWLANYFVRQRAGTLAVISSVAGDRGRKSNYIYGASKGALNVFLDGLRNRVDREGVNVLTIKPGPTLTPMTQHMPGSAKFATPQKVAADILGAVEKRKDVVYTPGIWAIIMFVIRAIPERIFKKLNL
ncbi:MAG: SDR family oxidoreductase [Acidobacteriaceae bacterium]